MRFYSLISRKKEEKHVCSYQQVAIDGAGAWEGPHSQTVRECGGAVAGAGAAWVLMPVLDAPAACTRGMHPRLDPIAGAPASAACPCAGPLCTPAAWGRRATAAEMCCMHFWPPLHLGLLPLLRTPAPPRPAAARLQARCGGRHARAPCCGACHSCMACLTTCSRRWSALARSRVRIKGGGPGLTSNQG